MDGGIPDVPTVRTLRPEDLAVENPAAVIQKALDTAESPGAITLPVGEWTLHAPLEMRPGIVLRGSGKRETRLLFDLPEPAEDGGVRPALGVVRFEGRRDAAPVPLIGDPAVGATSIELAEATDLAPGDTVLVFSDNDPDLMFTDPRWDRDWARESLAQIVAVKAVDGILVTLDTGLRLDFKPALHPRLQRLEPIRRAGLENLYLERIDGVSDNIVGLEAAVDCWVRNCETVRTGRGHIWMNYSRFVTITGNHCHIAIDYGGGGNGYGIVAGNVATDCLIENNLLHTLRHAMMAKRGSNGNVFAYNYSFDRRRDGGDNLLCDISLHGHYPYQNLFEGNVADFVELADFWGPTGPRTTFFRNHIRKRFEISDHSHETIVWNNVLPAEGIRDDGTSERLFIAHNGTPAFEGEDAENEEIALPVSLFYREKPSFWSASIPWPMAGPDRFNPTSDAPPNPAAARARNVCHPDGE